MLLRIEHLEKRYGGVQALNDVSFTLEAGTVLAVVGGNGAGKSTLMQCVTGAEVPDGGRVIFDQRSLPLGNPYVSRASGIEMIYQHLDLCAEQDVVTNVFLGREPRLEFFGYSTPLLDRARMERETASLLANLGSSVALHARVGALSGGQQQIVAIVRALLGHPKLLILDEPTAALGVQETARVLDLIRSLKNQGLAIILVSHQLGDILEVADRVVLMRHGGIVREMPARETTLSELTEEILR